MPNEERNILINRLSEIDPCYEKGELEEEAIDAYDTAINSLKAYTNSKFAKRLEKEILDR